MTKLSVTVESSGILEKDITLRQHLQLLCDLRLKHHDAVTPAHVFSGWFVCGEII